MKAKKEDLQKYALEAFGKLGKDFRYLKRGHLEDIEIFEFSGRPDRQFIGRLLLKCFQDQDLKYSGGKAQALFERSQKLKKEEKKSQTA